MKTKEHTSVNNLVRKNSREHAAEMKLEGRTARVLISGEVLGAETVSFIDVEIDVGQCTVPAHCHKFFEEVIYVRDGEARVWLEGEVVPLGAGEAILIPTGRRHMVKNVGNSKLCMLTCFGDKNFRRGFVEFPEINGRNF
jgi:putative monooxygenase